VNVQEATAHLKNVLAALKPAGGPDERGLLDDVRDSLDNTREATSDMAENMEALKRNWFFRGYFKRRGFFDLDAVSLEDYRQGKVAPKRESERSWQYAQELFKPDPAGRETLSDNGLKKLADAMVPMLRYAPNTLLIVEGYAGQGSESEQFLRSRDRARLVRRHLIDRFGLKPNFVGAIPMGAVASSGPSGAPFEGVSLVFFPEKKK
jgi:phospholipid/cholesterol/gamma-HCH transport system substrate-binding protein